LFVNKGKNKLILFFLYFFEKKRKIMKVFLLAITVFLGIESHNDIKCTLAL
tara:strand:+ start:619 stop:771 length:153 start_codon:yes stop_codon:yes gene_type:complete